MKKEKICIIGAGWLGKSLAQHLLLAQYEVLVTTAHDKYEEFKVSAIPYVNYDLTLELPLPLEIAQADILIYTVPPLELATVQSFFSKIEQDKKIIFTSSTSVYGNNLGEVDESFILDIKNTRSKLLLETETYLRAHFKNLTIIRPGGLYGDKRHPVYFLQGRKNLTTGHELLHLVHREDCINAISAIIKKNLWSETFNLISDTRISKKDYYVYMAKKLNLELPEYDDSLASKMQTNISNKNSLQKLNIVYRDPNQF